jgi:cysteine-rich repeat protein
LRVGSEACDDGNLIDSDGWSSTCTVEGGYTWTGGSAISADVWANLNWGNGVRDGGEECDDQNTSNGDGCSSIWTVEAGYTCSGGSPSTQDICQEIWGDSKRFNSFATYWDDGNVVSGDGWSSTWSIEIGYSCTGGSTTTADTWTPIWGDGLRIGAEVCDDGNAANGDGCSSTWIVEFGFACSGGSPSTQDTCQEIWGDGKRFNSIGTYCDDGNVFNGDGCDNGCITEQGYSCIGGSTTTADAWTPVWGYGLRIGVEECDDQNIANGDGCSSAWTTEVGFICTGGSPNTQDTCKEIWGDGKYLILLFRIATTEIQLAEMAVVQPDRWRLATLAQEELLSFLTLDLLFEEIPSKLEQRHVMTETRLTETDVHLLEVPKLVLHAQGVPQAPKTLAKRSEVMLKDSILSFRIATTEIQLAEMVAAPHVL